ncbi:hypothetical protein K5V21_12760 [Clostridium sardiniense]|uniref:Uncharacterized protein n=1 Tax=Clostridium sardiniense TaxID=29369 RepID=A0ABS7KZW8_CLOSR|nr:hypothetical protein [Clostridium sardiniense]MBY0756319.1 hypothetical protein [Clostridium sardiniense]MDQ0461476.1 hypothetical protein [Clostridium sardiniense]
MKLEVGKKRKRYRINFNDEELLKLNKITSDNKRKKAMSVFQYINKYVNTVSGFLEISLDRLYKKFKRYHKEISLTYFKELAKLLVEFKLLDIKKVGRLKFYGKKILNEISDKKEEFLKEIKKDKYENVKENEVKENKKTDELKVASKETVIETAYEVINEVGIKTGSRTYFQVIESLSYILDKKDIHINGMVKYIEKVIEDKVNKQSLFKSKLINIRNKVHKNNKIHKYIRFNDFPQRERSDEEWNNLEMSLLG